MSKKQSWEMYEDVARYVIDDIKSYLALSRVNQNKRSFATKDGGICEIDVSAYNISDEKLVIVECRNRNKPLCKEEIYGFAYRIQQTNAKRGIIVTPIGLQEGAQIAADGAKIGLVRLDPSSTLDKYIAQIIQILIVKVTDSIALGSLMPGYSKVTCYPVPQIKEQIEKVKERLKRKTNRTEFTDGEVLEEFVKMQNEI